MNTKNDLIYIKHILDSINAITDFSKAVTKKELVSNRMKQSAIVREIEIIGEAAKNVSKTTRNKYADVRWKEIAGTRDKMIHQYFGVDLDIILNIIKNDIPELEKSMLVIEKELENE